MTPWVLEDLHRAALGTVGLQRVLRARNIPVRVLPTEKMEDSIPEPVVFHGSFHGFALCTQVVPGYTATHYDVGCYRKFLTPWLLNGDATPLTVGELRRDPWTWMSRYGVEAKLFVRPDDGVKSFSGMLLDLQDQPQWLKGTPDDAKAWVSKPLDILGEWRFLIAGTQVAAETTYKYQGLDTFVAIAHPQAKQLAQIVAATAGYQPDPLYTLDIAETTDHQFRVIEPNSFHCASLYSMNPEAVVDAVLTHAH